MLEQENKKTGEKCKRIMPFSAKRSTIQTRENAARISVSLLSKTGMGFVLPEKSGIAAKDTMEANRIKRDRLLWVGEMMKTERVYRAGAGQ